MSLSGFLVLEDKTVFDGLWIGDSGWVGVGEVVFNTSLVGYQEILTDPSYYQQIIVMTAPEQGNYGALAAERESDKIWAEGFVCVELSPSVIRNRVSLQTELTEFQKPALTGVDTRSLTLHLRSRGTPWGTMLQAENKKDALSRALSLIEMRQKKISEDWVYKVSSSKTKLYEGQSKKGRVAVLDYGAKTNIRRSLQTRFKDVAFFNSRASHIEVLDWAPDGVMLTNGPGDPRLVKVAVEELKKLLGKVPVFGICMGHQLLALALGGSTYKLKFGHRGANHPVRDLNSNEIFMTSQNHGYAVHGNLPTGVQVSQINLYDQTVEGIEAKSQRAWSVQYHPEASPGPRESAVLFDRFANDVIN